MRLDDSRESDNVEDRRASGPRIGGRGTIGIGTIVLALVAMYFGVDPNVVLQMAEGPTAQQQQAPAQRPPADDPQACFVAKVLGETEDTWAAIFQNDLNRRYAPPAGAVPRRHSHRLRHRPVRHGAVLLSWRQQGVHRPGLLRRAEEPLQGAGRFRPGLRDRARGRPSRAAPAGHLDQVDNLRRRNPSQANALSVRMELQADCFAGLWAQRANAARQILESGDVEEALAAATAIGDDRLQKQSQGYVVPDTLTHGSEQRVRWFKRGLEGGSPSSAIPSRPASCRPADAALTLYGYTA